jgi:hypothetical protein
MRRRSDRCSGYHDIPKQTRLLLSYNHSQRGCVCPLAKAAVGVDTAAVTAAVVAVVPAELAGGQSESL